MRGRRGPYKGARTNDVITEACTPVIDNAMAPWSDHSSEPSSHHITSDNKYCTHDMHDI